MAKSNVNSNNKIELKSKIETEKFIFPQELEVWYLLPAIRKKLALALVKEGMAQKEVAKIMGISAATISHYKKDKRAKKDIIGDSLDSDINKSVKKIVNDSSVIFSEIMNLTKIVKKKGLLCEIYQKQKNLVSKLPCCDCKPGSKFCH